MGMFTQGGFWGLFATGLAGGLITLVSACAGTSGESWADEENVGELQQAAACDPKVSNTCCDPAVYRSCYYQSSGLIKVKYYQGYEVSSNVGSTTAKVRIEDGWKLIGGGAQISDTNAGPGFTGLVESYPDQQLAAAHTWFVKSQEVGGTRPHSLLPYAIAVKFTGYSRETAPIWETSGDWSAPAAHSGSSVQVPSGMLLLGGGFSVLGPNFNSPPKAGVVDAYAENMINGTWHTNASTLNANNTARVLAHAIYMERCPAKWSVCATNRKIIEGSSPTGTGVQVKALVNPYDGYLTLGVGVISSSWDRPIFETFPLGYDQVSFGGAIAGTRHPSASGYAKTQAIMLNMQ